MKIGFLNRVALIAALVVAGATLPANAAFNITYNFEDPTDTVGTDEGWTNILTSPSTPVKHFMVTNSNAGFWAGGGAFPAHSGSFRVVPGPSNAAGDDDAATSTLLFRSPEFVLGTGATITLRLAVGASPGTAPTSFSDLVTNYPTSSASGWQGVALRNVTDGETYPLTVLSAGGWNAVGFTSAQLAPHFGDVLTLDLIDQKHGGGGWIALDTVQITNAVPEPASFAAIGLAGALGMLSRHRRGRA